MGAKLRVVVVDRGQEYKVVTKASGVIETHWPFTAHVLENPNVSVHGKSEDEVVQHLVELVLTKGAGQKRKVVEVDLEDHMVVKDVLET